MLKTLPQVSLSKSQVPRLPNMTWKPVTLCWQRVKRAKCQSHWTQRAAIERFFLFQRKPNPGWKNSKKKQLWLPLQPSVRQKHCLELPPSLPVLAQGLTLIPGKQGARALALLSATCEENALGAPALRIEGALAPHGSHPNLWIQATD